MKLSTPVQNFITDSRLRGLARETLISYESDLRLLVSLATVSAADSALAFTPELVRTYFMTLSKKNLKMSTLHRRRASEFGKWGLRQRLWAENPAAALPRIKRQRPLPRPFDQGERDKLFALGLEGHEIVLRSLLYYSGLRVSEVCGLRLCDVALGDGSEANPGRLLVTGKGSRQRTVPLVPELRAILHDWILKATDLKPRSFVIAQKDGRPYKRKTVERRTTRWGRGGRCRRLQPASLPTHVRNHAVRARGGHPGDPGPSWP